MVDVRFSMFNDRRKARDRRLQSLPMPQTLDRRLADSRRQRNFQSKPWWLSIDYCEELISSQKTPIKESGESKPLAKNPGSSPLKTS